MPGTEQAVTLRFLAEPGTVNFGGKVQGGLVMKWIDQAGYACAVGWSGQYCVTVYVGGIRFYKPVLIGHLVEVRARVIHTGVCSMHLAVDVSTRDPSTGRRVHTTHCVIVFVALDSEGHPTPVPVWQSSNAEDMALEQYAVKLMELGKAIEKERVPYEYAH